MEEAKKLRDADLERVAEILAKSYRNPQAPTWEAEAPAKTGAEILAKLRQLPAVKQEIPKPPAAETRYFEKCVSPPGHFPPKFVKVPVRNPGAPEEPDQP